MAESQSGGNIKNFTKNGPVCRRSSFLGRVKRIPLHIWNTFLTLHHQAVRGDKEAVNEACHLLEKIRRYSSANNLIEAYYGSILTLLGRDAVDPIERLDKVKEGLKFLDEAVQNEPDNIEIRILRGYVCLRLPEVFFHRTATGIEDFKYLVECMDKDPTVFSSGFYHQLLRDLGAAYQTLGRKEEAQFIQEKLDRFPKTVGKEEKE